MMGSVGGTYLDFKMSKLISYTVLIGALALAIAPAGQTSVAASGEGCFNDWATASAIVADRRMVNVAELSQIARNKFQGQLLTARLCRDKLGYFYRLVIRDNNGRVKRVRVDAPQAEAKRAQ